MDRIMETMLGKYNPQNKLEKENAVKEIIQEIALSGLSHGGFFDKAAFYGGTCLRIFHGLNRFSEDLDFALLKKGDGFALNDYFLTLEKEFRSYGIEIQVEEKRKSAESKVQSAFLKGNTITLMMSFFPQDDEMKKIISNKKMKIKFEVDTDNPSGGRTETKFRMLPSPYEVKIFDEATLFAGKIHAIICRNYQRHVKGRDYYDFLFYIGKDSPFNLTYLENKLKNTGGILKENESLTLTKVRELLKERFESLDFESAKDDVRPFISNKENLELWKKELFLSTLDNLKGE